MYQYKTNINIMCKFRIILTRLFNELHLLDILYSYYYESYVFSLQDKIVYVHGLSKQSIKTKYECDVIARNEKYLFMFGCEDTKILDLVTFSLIPTRLCLDYQPKDAAAYSNLLIISNEYVKYLYDVSDITKYRLLKTFNSFPIYKITLIDSNYIYCYDKLSITVFNHKFEEIKTKNMIRDMMSCNLIDNILIIKYIGCLLIEYFMFTGDEFEKLEYDYMLENFGNHSSKIVIVENLIFEFINNVLKVRNRNYKIVEQFEITCRVDKVC